MHDLVTRLMSDKQLVRASRMRDSRDLEASIARAFVLLTFPNTRGGTELGIALDESGTDRASADFASGRGRVGIRGTCTLDFNKLEVAATLDLESLEGEARVSPLPGSR